MEANPGVAVGSLTTSDDDFLSMDVDQTRLLLVNCGITGIVSEIVLIRDDLEGWDLFR